MYLSTRLLFEFMQRKPTHVAQSQKELLLIDLTCLSIQWAYKNKDPAARLPKCVQQPSLPTIQIILNVIKCNSDGKLKSSSPRHLPQ